MDFQHGPDRPVVVMEGLAREFGRPWHLERLWVTGKPLRQDGPLGMVVLAPSGFRNGYVRLPEGHPWIGLDIWDEPPVVVVHGGLTFSGLYPAEQLDPPTDIPEGPWWIGFDCGHAFDNPEPGYWDAVLGFPYPIQGGHVWTTDEVAAQVEFLAGQVFEAWWDKTR